MPKINSLKNIALAIAIAIVLNVFVGVGLNSFYPSPNYDDFCDQKIYEPRMPIESSGQIDQKEIEEANRCSEEYNTARDLYNRNAFLVFVVVGLIALVAGWSFVTAPAVSTGLVYGGVLAFIVGTVTRWSGTQDTIRFIVIGVILVTLLWLGIRKKQSAD